MNEEKKKILSLIESGKISAEEGMKLLDALDDVEYEDFISEDDILNEFEKEEKTESKYQEEDVKKEKREYQKKNWNYSGRYDNWDEKFGKKFAQIGEEISKKAIYFSEKVLDKVEEFIDNKKFEKFWGNSEENMETDNINIKEKISSVNVKAINGKIGLQTWDEDEIQINVKYYLKENNIVSKPYYYSVEDGELKFAPNMEGKISINLEIFIPEKEYKEISLVSRNGKITVGDLKAEKLNCKTKNSSIKIDSSFITDAIVDTKNGRVVIDDTEVKKLDVVTANSSISLNDIKGDNIKAVTQNGHINVNDLISRSLDLKTTNACIKLKDSKNEFINCETSNAKIILNDISSLNLKEVVLLSSNGSINTVFSDNKRNYFISGETTQGNILIDIPDLDYDLNEKNHQGNKKVIAKTYKDGIDEDKIVKVSAKTSNGSIYIK